MNIDESQQIPSSSSSEPDKKRNRIDSFAAVLANRSRTNTNEQERPQTSRRLEIQPEMSKQMLYTEDDVCPICGLNDSKDGRKCSHCKKKKPFMGGDTIFSGIQRTDADDISDEEIGNISNLCNFNNEIGTSAGKFHPAHYSANSPQQRDKLVEMHLTHAASVLGSKTPTPQPEGTCSDNDEYQPPGISRKLESSRGGRGKGKGKKPSSAIFETTRQTTMKTRSGGKPPTISYAAKFSTAYSSEIEERFGGQRMRGKGSKGNSRNRRNGARGGKLISVYTAALVNSRRESGQRDASEDRGKLSPEKNDYIRTAVVTSANDKFMIECPNLCLICGSIGKDAESAMISCMACAQSFHTYCVSMQDKLNMTLIKRGWRCLDCTVCEGCGSGEDESNLLLCDECDISYHIYCLDPPLGSIPPGSWRCKWCSTCARCNIQVKTGINLQPTDGYCEICHSLRKCPKCSKFYEIGDIMLKCQHCLRWLHGRCEGHSTEEQVENAAENSFRCSFCRPKTFNDASNIPIVVDNVMVNKSMVEQIHNFRRFPLFGDQSAILRSFSSEHDDIAEMDDTREQYIPGLFSTRGRGGSSRGGPGRRVLKLGIGGFTVRNPKNRSSVSIGLPTNLSIEEEHQTPGVEEDGNASGKPKIRRPRKLRKPLLEDAYPANIQESFFGVSAVESRTLAEQSVEEPLLAEYKKAASNVESIKLLSELTEHSAELLRNEQEMDMLDGIPLVDDIGLDMDIGNLDFTDLIVGGEDEEAMVDNVDSLDEGFNAGSTSSLIQSNTVDVCSPSSASSNRIPSGMNESINHTRKTSLVIQGQQQNQIAKPIEQHRLSAAAQAAERWEEDEPLGDKATKAAVLYANVHHADLKEKFPLWSDRVRQINKVWRELSSEKRQQFVEWARKNRVNCPTPRKRGRRTNSFGNPTQQQQPGISQQNLITSEKFVQPPPTAKIDGLIKNEMPIANSSMPPEQYQFQSALVNQSIPPVNQQQQLQTEFQKREMELKGELQIEEEKIEKMKKYKRTVAAKQRQIVKRIESAIADEREIKGLELKDVEINLNSAKKAIQTQQRIVDKCRQRLKEHANPHLSQQMANKFSILAQQPSTSSQYQEGTTPEIEINHQSTTQLELKQFNIAQQQPNQFPFIVPSQSSISENIIFSTSTTAIPVKGTRGRKRKKPLPEQIRTPILGGVPFVSLQADQEKDIYDLVDSILHVIETNTDGKTADALFVKRILLSQQQHEQIYSESARGIDACKAKKKRQVLTKGRIQSDMNNEFEQVQERVKDSLFILPMPIQHSLEQYQANDKHMLKYPNQTGLPDHPSSQLPLSDKAIGDLSLSFMPDFYNDLEIHRENYIDEESLFPPLMDDICAVVDLDELELNTDEAEQCVKIANNPDESENAAVGLDLPFLSIDNIADRTKLGKSTILLGSNGPEMEVPIDPHCSRFEEEPVNLSREVEVIIDIDPSMLPREDFLNNLRQLLRDSDITATEIETPPQTPASPKPSLILNDSNVANYKKIGGHENNADQISSYGSSKLFCEQCRTLLTAGQRPIEEFAHRFGLNNDKEHKFIFCTLQCYFKFLAIWKVPLAVGLLEIAENYVDEGTVEKLRQISAENFAKRINAGEANPQFGCFEQNQVNLISSILPSSANIIENAYNSREIQLRPTELATLMQNSKYAQEIKKDESEYKWRGHGWTKCDFDLIQSFQRHQDEVNQKFSAINVNNKNIQYEDTRHCSFCGKLGDGDQELSGRLLNLDANEWVHVNCALWSAEVHVSEEGALMNVDSALMKARKVECKFCGQLGASIRCYKLDCANKDIAFHLLCARSNGFFIKDKTYFCANHEIRPDALVMRLDALRRLFIYRDENQLLSKIFNHSCSTEMVMRVGSLIFHKIGQLLPDQLKAFTTQDCIFPTGYKITRIFWHLTNVNERERMHYECTILDKNGIPEFIVRVVEMDKEFGGANPSTAWSTIQKNISMLREKTTLLCFFPTHMSGESLFGFTEPSISKMLESLPGVDQLYTYNFKHGGTPLMDLPLAENPSGCARCEPCFRTLVKRKHRPIISNSPKKNDEKNYNSEAVVSREGRVRSTFTSRFAASSSAKFDQEVLRAYKASGISERMLQAPYLRNNEAAQLVAQYKEMKKEWKENVYLARSKIQGLGLYTKRDLDMNQMIIEYIGEMIRNEVCEMRQKKYTEQNRGEYMFRIDIDWVVDATMCGGLARYINHSCDPNCGTKILTINDEKKIVIYANRPIKAGEELTYDYQFEIEESSKKIPCLCGAPNCARWMN